MTAYLGLGLGLGIERYEDGFGDGCYDLLHEGVLCGAVVVILLSILWLWLLGV